MSQVPEDMIFVFGSNEAGIHGAGAALTAVKEFGAVYRKGFGHAGKSFAIPTKDRQIKTLPLETIERYVDAFIALARVRGDYMRYKVTRIGCGLAGYKDKDIAPLFKDAPENCWFDLAWKPWLGETKNYWGTM